MSAILNKLASILLLVFVLAGPLAVPLRAQDSAQTIRALLEQRDDQIKRLLGDKETFTDEQRAQLKTVINDVIDFEAMGREALGPHWDDLTPEQSQAFTDVFSEIVRSQSLSNLDIYRSQVTYEDVSVEDGKARVTTSTVYKDVPTKVVYLLDKNDQQWRAYDIILDDVSTAEGYARSFQSVIRKKGFDALMASLNKKLDKINAASSE
jgi:phospholipid transport system substrate-binding protein